MVTILLACVIFALSVGSAMAAAEVTKAKSITYAYVGSGADSTLILTVVLADDTKLPANVRFNYPTGIIPGWTGEVLGGATTDDPTVTTTKIKDGSTWTTYEATLTKSKTLQIEGTAEVDTANMDTTNVVASIQYRPAIDATQVVLGTEIPKTATILKTSGASDLGAGKLGEMYGIPQNDVKAGKDVTAQIVYKTSAAAATSQTGAKKSNTALTVIIVVLALAFIALVVVLLSRRMGSEAPSQKKSGGSKSRK
ncbi:MAG: hypothetical protein JJE36_04895 [Coriobacteriia bacterium]|nr:hypothetical protein [Coriobacteriia bacterium]